MKDLATLSNTMMEVNFEGIIRKNAIPFQGKNCGSQNMQSVICRSKHTSFHFSLFVFLFGVLVVYEYYFRTMTNVEVYFA